MSITQHNPKAGRRMPIGMRTDMYYRIPGRDHRTQITHKMPKDMNRKEWRAFLTTYAEALIYGGRKLR